MSKKDRKAKRGVRIQALSAKKEVTSIAKRLQKEKDQFGWQSKKVSYY